jgi:putative two-component system response regulator
MLKATEPRNRQILVVDDMPQNRDLLMIHIEIMGHIPVPACSGAEALSLLNPSIDMVLLDVMMPDMDGFTVTRTIRAHPTCSAVPIVLCTALNAKVDRLAGVEAGASDFISKPIDKTELRIRVAAQLRLKLAQDELLQYQAGLEEKVEQRTQELYCALEAVTLAHMDTVQRLALAAECRTEDVAEHLEHVAQYSVLLGEACGFSDPDLELLYHASRMHDVGKMSLPDSILHKPGPLTAEERKIMEGHTTSGAELLGGSSSLLMQLSEEIALNHHERWDGTGYPQGLAGLDIPLAGRICAIADVCDALMAVRSYKPAYSAEETREIMLQGRGTHFDPALLDLFFDNFDTVLRICNQKAKTLNAPSHTTAIVPKAA